MYSDKIHQDYVKIYGEPRPCYFLYKSFQPENFRGVKREGTRVRFDFAKPVSFIFGELDVLEMQFRNRLVRKISFSVSDTSFAVDKTSFAEEEQEELELTIADLERFFSGKPMSSRLKAEISLYRKKLNWRDAALVASEMAKF